MLSFKSFSKSQNSVDITQNWHFSSLSNVSQKQYLYLSNLIWSKVFIRKKNKSYLPLKWHIFLLNCCLLISLCQHSIKKEFYGWKKIMILYKLMFLLSLIKIYKSFKKYQTNYLVYLNSYIYFKHPIINFHVPYQWFNQKNTDSTWKKIANNFDGVWLY